MTTILPENVNIKRENDSSNSGISRSGRFSGSGKIGKSTMVSAKVTDYRKVIYIYKLSVFS